MFAMTALMTLVALPGASAHDCTGAQPCGDCPDDGEEHYHTGSDGYCSSDPNSDPGGVYDECEDADTDVKFVTCIVTKLIGVQIGVQTTE